jgi:uncharacterized protein YbjT (DUF2867 family)
MKIAVAGSTGNLGLRVVRELIKRGATVVALVRPGAKTEALVQLKATGASLEEVAARACQGAECVVSCVAGLRDVIVEAQNVILQAALQAGVPRFVPSDFSTDFTRLVPGQNRNFDLRRDFHRTLDAAPIAATAIFNGAFAEILGYNVPIFDFKKKTVGYWGDPGHLLDFTTMDDVAAYTAAAALDPTTPRALRIASFQVTPQDLVQFTNGSFQLVCLGTVEELRAQNESARAAHPEGENELYCRWQQGQYMQSMFSTTHEALDNARYPELTWARLENVLQV